MEHKYIIDGNKKFYDTESKDLYYEKIQWCDREDDDWRYNKRLCALLANGMPRKEAELEAITAEVVYGH